MAGLMSRSEALRALLLRHRGRDPTEERDRERVLALLERDEGAFDRHRWSPGHITASAFVVDPGRRQLLLIHHAKLGMWLQPGGHVDPEDADVAAAARRELWEEAGIEVSAGAGTLLQVDIHRIPARPDQPTHEHFDVRWLFTIERREARAGSDALAARWVSLDDLAQVDTDDSVRRAAAHIPA